ncbi:hypothetical protein TRVA0_087S00144 [Trichomonascus vanleenenianus]|uniref:uncharacterized protein n=1 Tax=Trichomonascus vanleenenianus TaxID=2268995 RepID=UPI003ECB325E
MLPWKITCAVPLIITAVAAVAHEDIWRTCKIIGPAIGTKFMGRRKAMVVYGGVLGDSIIDVIDECLSEELQWVTSKRCVKSIVTSGVQMCLAALDQGYATGQHGAKLVLLIATVLYLTWSIAMIILQSEIALQMSDSVAFNLEGVLRSDISLLTAALAPIKIIVRRAKWYLS